MLALTILFVQGKTRYFGLYIVVMWFWIYSKPHFKYFFFKIMWIQIKGEIVASVAPADRGMFFLTP